jgi:vacuolar-type H+-ATPase subunit I/STV1
MGPAARVERLIWIFIYAGLFAVAVGMAVRSGIDGLHWMLIGGGAVSVSIGALLVWVRSRMKDDG